MRIADIGEFPLIDRLERIIASARPDVLVGLGDDVAVLETQGDTLLLATIDIQVENIHFLRHLITPQQLGRRALAINLSDIAAMGGQPQFALVSLALPSETEVDWVEELYRGMRAEADQYGAVVVGGNMTRTQAEICVDVALLGRVQRDQVLLRSGARPGDQVLVTGRLGEGAAGLHLGLNPEFAIDPADRTHLLARYLTPTPRVVEAAIIARTRRATAMIDISDGLSSDVGHICDRSKVGMRIWAEHLPISAAVHQVARLAETTPWQLVLTGGDDYELCFTAPPDAVDNLIAAVQAETGTPVTVIGEVLPAAQERWLVLPDGRDVPLAAGGWEHFGAKQKT